MACFWHHQKETNIDIPASEEISNVTYYRIKVTVGSITWETKHRYSEFFELHNQLVVDHGVSKDILPSKKVIRNKCPLFIESRRRGLEEYLQKILIFLNRTMPKIFVEFLDFHLYDIFFLLQNMSSKVFSEADLILTSSKSYNFTPLELHALRQCLRNSFPVTENLENQYDVSPIVELCSQLIKVKIIGDYQKYLQSNIVLNELPFELSLFKSVRCLHIKNACLSTVTLLGTVRNTVSDLVANHTDAKSICDVFQCDVLHKSNLEGSEKWASLETLDLSNNNLTEIDHTISLAKKLKTLILDDNKISTISNLTHLPNLSYLSISNNLIAICKDLHTKVGNILKLDLSQNNIVTTEGFSRLYSLESLNLCSNKIAEIEEVEYIGKLPCLENLILTGNSVSTTVDYRIKVLELFDTRAKYICLDNERPSQAELDKVSVLRALRIVKEGRTPNLTQTFNT